MGPRLTQPRPRTDAPASARLTWRERRQDAQLRKELAARPQHVRNELLEMLSRQR
ncbi:hypothetical protein [Ornithinicoccus hortensis]|uniref:Uncharacterized protein n=1 Tax=Ornithinicoccus hortensis TaxID=82346 RepID=A0A542YNI9_9MICO|nr:hypothetical protein [Ornithinicoccus hortensis]TQL49666.1 hypothetical protein FB467_0751 [Ornithinicoccus hortensis]